MADEVNKVETAEQTGEPVVTAPEPDPKEELTRLRSELEQAKAERAKFEKNWKNEQNVSSWKQKKIDELKQANEDVQSLKDQMKVLAAVVAEGKGESEEELDTRTRTNKVDLLKQFDEINIKRAAERKQKELNDTAEQFKLRVESLGLTPADDEYHVVRAFVVAGEFDKAEKRLSTIEESRAGAQRKEVKEEKPQVVTAPQLSEADEERIALAYAKKKNWLKQEVVSPAGGGSFAGIPTDYDELNEFIRKMPQVEYEKNYAARVRQMVNEGKIKRKP